MKIEIPVELLQPWSTFIMKTQLPPPILEKMIRITDEMVEDITRKSDSLALSKGLIEDQFRIEWKILERENLVEFILGVCRTFITQAFGQSQPFNKEAYLKEEWLLQLTHLWVNSQKDNEYLPMHSHPGSEIAGVMYLKIPEYLPSNKPTKDGAIMFINTPSQDLNWTTAILEILPNVGDFFIFPSSQSHQVYPFKTLDKRGERRSVSFNVCITNKSIQEMKQQKEELTMETI
jgi:hypothetical protein